MQTHHLHSEGPWSPDGAGRRQFQHTRSQARRARNTSRTRAARLCTTKVTSTGARARLDGRLGVLARGVPLLLGQLQQLLEPLLQVPVRLRQPRQLLELAHLGHPVAGQHSLYHNLGHPARARIPYTITLVTLPRARPARSACWGACPARTPLSGAGVARPAPAGGRARPARSARQASRERGPWRARARRVLEA